MAPKLSSVRSESWLDLTWAANGNENSRGDDPNDRRPMKLTCTPNYRHSIGDFSSSSGGAGNEHLLIRLRQQSYLRNRRSASLSSNLSNSIELDRFDDASTTTTATAMSVAVAPPAASSPSRPTLLKEPVGLKLLRHRLERKPTKRRISRGDQSQPPEQEIKGANSGLSSTSRRSWSSLSEQIGGKLSHLGHSWKHFLYNYNKSRSRDKQQVSSDVQSSQSNDYAKQATSSIDEEKSLLSLKRRLTLDWVQQQQVEWLARKDDVGRAPGESMKRPGRANERPNSFHEFNEGFNKSNTDDNVRQKSPNIHRLSTQTSRGVKISPLPLTSPLESSTSSSTTLVSEMILNNNNNKQNIIIQDHNQLRNSMYQQQQQQQQQANNANSGKMQFLNVNNIIQAVEPAHVATSDYWSATSKSDQSLGQQQQHQHQPTSNNQMNVVSGDQQVFLLPNTPALADADYYLDVAMNAAATNECDRLETPTSMSMSPTSMMMMSPTSNHIIRQQQHQYNDNNQQLILMQRMAAAGQQHQHQHQQQMMNSQLINDDYDDYAVPAHESCCRLDRSQVELVQLIGEGQKGFVFLGKLQSKDGQHIVDVAIKTLKYETDLLIDRLMSEAAMMRQLEHPHIIKFIGVCPETPALIAMELAQFGEIKSFLKLNKHLIRLSQLVLYTFQISTALSYLESKHYVHRDVAARNVLVCSHTCVKLADFGLTRNLQPNLLISTSGNSNMQARQQQQQQQQQMNLLAEDMSQLIDPNDRSHYVAAPRVKLPVRWLAPESLVFRRFTSASDVWMFAVCSWELFHFGQVRPWPELRNQQVLMAIEAGQRLARPANCPARLYQLMLQCWSYAPVQRPKFREIKHCIWSIYLSERTREQLELEKLEQQRQRFMHMQGNLQQNYQHQVMMDKRRDHQQILAHHQQRPMSSSPQMTTSTTATAAANLTKVSATSNLINANYAQSNCSSSSVMTNNEHDSTTDQSRGSSMNSLARLKQNQRQQQQQQQQQQQIGNQQMLCHQLNRFQARPARAHLLQKQRSQGTITSEAANSRHEQQMAAERRLARRGLDDAALVGPHRRRPQQVAVVESDDDDEDDDDDDDLGSESDLDERQIVATRNQQQTHRLAAKPRLEPSYDGVFDEPAIGGQVAMLRAHYDKNNMNNNRQFDACLRPVTSSGKKPSVTPNTSQPAKPTATNPNANNHREPDHLGQVLQALSITPMKAKLKSPPAQTVRMFSRQNPTPPDEPAKVASASPASPNHGQLVRQQRVDDMNRTTREEEQQQRQRDSQLQLHRRLLGRIRPASIGANGSQRTSRPTSGQFNYQQAQQHSMAPADSNNKIRVETVDQSLQILESLISPGHQQLFPKRPSGQNAAAAAAKQRRL